MSFLDRQIGSKGEHVTTSVPTEAVVLAQPFRISSDIGSSAARIARLANEIERMCGRLRCWRFQRGKIQRGELVAEGLAEGEELASNILCNSLALSSGYETVLRRPFVDRRLRDGD